MSFEDFQRIPFERDGEVFEVWLLVDRIANEFKIEARKDARPLRYRLGNGEWLRLSYHVSFETEQDAKAVHDSSAVLDMIETAKADLEKYDFSVSSSEING